MVIIVGEGVGIRGVTEELYTRNSNNRKSSSGNHTHMYTCPTNHVPSYNQQFCNQGPSALLTLVPLHMPQTKQFVDSSYLEMSSTSPGQAGSQTRLN